MSTGPHHLGQHQVQSTTWVLIMCNVKYQKYCASPARWRPRLPRQLVTVCYLVFFQVFLDTPTSTKNSSRYSLTDLLPFRRLSWGGAGEGYVNLVKSVSLAPTRQKQITQLCPFLLCDFSKVT